MTVQAPVPDSPARPVGWTISARGSAQNNAEVYGELLGFGGNDIDDLHARGVL